MERFAISFDTSKTCLNYNEFVPNQVFTLPGGAYMSTHLDDDGSHRVSINLESLLLIETVLEIQLFVMRYGWELC